MRSGSDVGGVDLAIGFEGGATAEQADQLKILVTGVLALVRVEEFLLVDLEHGGGGVGAFEIAAEADELPALAVNHGGVADALEEMNAIDDGGERVVDAGGELSLRVGRVHLVEEAIEALPLLAGDFFADLAGIFAGAVDAEGDGGGADAIEDECAGHGFKAALPLHARGLAERGKEALPAGFEVGAAGVEQEAHGHVELAHGVLGALEVAAHPVETVGYA